MCWVKTLSGAVTKMPTAGKKPSLQIPAAITMNRTVGTTVNNIYEVNNIHILHWWCEVMISFYCICLVIYDELRSSDAKWWRVYGSTMVRAMACCLPTSNHYPNHCSYIIKGVLWHSSVAILQEVLKILIHKTGQNNIFSKSSPHLSGPLSWWRTQVKREYSRRFVFVRKTSFGRQS